MDFEPTAKQSGATFSPSRRILRAFPLGVLILVGWLAAGPEAQADEAAAEAATRPRVAAAVEAEAAARRAEQAARVLADSLAAELDGSLDDPRALAEERIAATSVDTSVSRADLDQAVARAEAAADAAWRAARAAERLDRKARHRGSQTGAYLGAALAYAVESFEDRIIVKSGLAGSVFVGYHFMPLVAAELRYEGFDGFKLRSATGRGEIEGYAITVHAKLYPIEGSIQPFLGVGLGGLRLVQEFVLTSGSRSQVGESDIVFRFFAGFDLPITDPLSVNSEAAYLAPGDRLSNLDIGVLGAGLS